MDRITSNLPERYRPKDKKERVGSELWAVCAEVAQLTGTTPNRWLRVGLWALQRSLIDYKEAYSLDEGGHATIRNRAAYFTWLTKKHGKAT